MLVCVCCVCACALSARRCVRGEGRGEEDGGAKKVVFCFSHPLPPPTLSSLSRRARAPRSQSAPTIMGAPTSPTSATLLARAAPPTAAATTRRRSTRIASGAVADGSSSSPAPPPPPVPPRRRRSLISKLGQSWNPTGIALFGRVLLVCESWWRERNGGACARPLSLSATPLSSHFPCSSPLGRLRPAGPAPPLHPGRRGPGLGRPQGRRLHGRRLRQGQHPDRALLLHPHPGRRGRGRGRGRRLGPGRRRPALQLGRPGPVRPGRRGGGRPGGRPGRPRHPARHKKTGWVGRRAGVPLPHPTRRRPVTGHGGRPLPDRRGVRQQAGPADGAAGAGDGGRRAPGGAAGEFFWVGE